MSRRGRLALFAVAGSGLLAVLLIGLRGLPAFGHYHGVYGLRVAKVEPPARHATDIVTALNFDLRAFDTLGEEFILFASVTGVALLLRHLRDEDELVERRRGLEDHTFAGASDALRVMSLILIPLLVALGAYLALHGQLTPGGGFQAGIVLAAGPLAILLAGRYLALKRVAPEWALEALDSVGATAYALIGLGGLIFAGVYFKNYLPLGTSGQLLSAGMMPLNSIAVGLEVTGAFLLTWTEFLDQALLVEHRELAG
jgi:multicomponent Na+:H+ antiporter subunit B